MRDDLILVKAFWDEEAAVWVASSEDVPGLAIEADSCDTLVKRLQVVIPELLEANGIIDPNGPDEIPFKLLNELTAVAYREKRAH